MADGLIRQLAQGSGLRQVVHAALLVAVLATGAGCEKLAGLFGGQKPPPPSAGASATGQAATPARPTVLPGDVLATVNGTPVSTADLERRIEEFKALTANMGQPWTALAPPQLEAGLDELINNELMSQDAVARGLDRSLDAQRRWEYNRREFFAQEWLRWNKDRLDVGAEDVERFYEQNKQGFREPEWRRLRQLTVASEDQAKQALAQLHGGAIDFSALAKQISLAPTASDGGLLPRRVMRAAEKAFSFPNEADAESAGVASLDPTLEAAAFAIDQVHGLSNYVKGPDGQFHLFQLAERQAERQRPLTEVWDQVKNYLMIQKLQQAVEELRAKAKVEKFPERLETVSQ